MKPILIITLLTLMAFARSPICIAQKDAASVQTEDPATVVAMYMKNTQMPVFACLKHMKATTQTVQPEDLSNAIKLQDYSKLLFDSGNYGDALICSCKARQLALKVLSDFRGEEYAAKYAKFANETAEYLSEILLSDTSTTQEWVTRVKLN